jgi:hypothetical protein
VLKQQRLREGTADRTPAGTKRKVGRRIPFRGRAEEAAFAGKQHALCKGRSKPPTPSLPPPPCLSTLKAAVSSRSPRVDSMQRARANGSRFAGPRTASAPRGSHARPPTAPPGGQQRDTLGESETVAESAESGRGRVGAPPPTPWPATEAGRAKPPRQRRPGPSAVQGTVAAPAGPPGAGWG